MKGMYIRRKSSTWTNNPLMRTHRAAVGCHAKA